MWVIFEQQVYTGGSTTTSEQLPINLSTHSDQPAPFGGISRREGARSAPRAPAPLTAAAERGKVRARVSAAVAPADADGRGAVADGARGNGDQAASTVSWAS